MIRVGVVEDDERSRLRVIEHLARYEREHGESFSVSSYADGRDLLAVYRADLDLLFLDIQMEHVDGMTTARRIRETDGDVIIVFITNSPQYAISGYEVAALSYLLKPVSYAAFAQEMTRSLRQLAGRESRHVILATAGEHHRVDVARIVFVESVKHRLIVHTDEREYHVPGPLRDMEAELATAGFFRSNNCYLVNLRHVTGVTQGRCVLRGGQELQVSRPRKKEFMAALADYIGGMGARA